MKTKLRIVGWLALLALSTLNPSPRRNKAKAGQPLFIRGMILLLAAFSLTLEPSTAFAQGTAFSYQGKLNDNGGPATGIYDLRFTIFDAVTNGNVVSGILTNAATSVTNGLFTVTLDFGSGVFTGNARWLEIAVRTNGASGFVTLTPRQPLTPTPYAILAGTAGGLSGTLPVSQVSGVMPLAQLPAAVITNNATGVTLVGATNVNPVISGGSGSFGGSAASAQTAASYTGQLLYGQLLHTPQTIASLLMQDGSTATPFRVVLVGDSLMVNQEPYIEQYFRERGSLLGYFGGAQTWSYAGGGANNNLDFTNFVNGFVGTLPNLASTVLAGAHTTYYGDTVEFIYETGSGFGTNMVYSSPDGTAFTWLTNTPSTASATTNLLVNTYQLPTLGMWTVKVIATNGPTRIIGATIYHHLNPGVIVYDFAHGGYGFSNFAACYPSVLTNIAQKLDPNLIICQEIHTSGNGWPTVVASVLNPLASNTNTDVLLLSPNLTYAQDNTDTPAIKALALTNHWVFWDANALWSLTGQNSNDWVNATNWLYMSPTPSDPHPTVGGMLDEINGYFRDTGLQNAWSLQNSDRNQTFVNSGTGSGGVVSWEFNNPSTASIEALVLSGLPTVKAVEFKGLFGNLLGGFGYNNGVIDIFESGGNNLFQVDLSTWTTTVKAELDVVGNGGNGVGLWVQNGMKIIGNGSGLTNLSMTFTNASGATFHLIVNSTTNGFNFVSP